MKPIRISLSDMNCLSSDTSIDAPFFDNHQLHVHKGGVDFRPSLSNLKLAPGMGQKISAND